MVNQLSVLPSVSGRIMLGGELKGWEVTGIRVRAGGRGWPQKEDDQVLRGGVFREVGLCGKEAVAHKH